MQRVCQRMGHSALTIVGCGLASTRAVAGPTPDEAPAVEPAGVPAHETVIRGAVAARTELLLPLSGYSGKLTGGGAGLEYWLEWPAVAVLGGMVFRTDFEDGPDYYRQIAHQSGVYWLAGGDQFTPVLGSGLSVHLLSASVEHTTTATSDDGLFRETVDGTSTLFGVGGNWFVAAGLLAFRRNKLRVLGTVSYSIGPDVLDNPQAEHAIHVSVGVIGGG